MVYKKRENVPPPSSALEILSVEAIDEEGNIITELSGESAGAKVKLKNGGSDLENAVVICAVVDKNNIIVSCGLQNIELTADGKEKEVTVFGKNIPEEACGLKVFIWQGLGDNQIPHMVHRTLIWEGN